MYEIILSIISLNVLGTLVLTTSCAAKSKKLRRKAAKKQRKLEALKEASGNFQEIKVSMTQQSIDLPSNEDGTLAGATDAEEARRELRVAMRNERRKKIKEKNYLRSV